MALKSQGLEPESGNGVTSSHGHSGFQFFSVALDAIQFPLSLRVLSSGHGSGPQAAHEASALPGGWAESLEAGGEDQYETHPGELLHPVCFALTHLIILGKTKHTGSQPYPRTFWVPTDY